MPNHVSGVVEGYHRIHTARFCALDAEEVEMFGNLGAPELLILIVVAAVPVVLFWLIFSKAGFPGVMGLLVLIPVLGFLIVLIVLAFTEWPVERELREARQRGHG